MSELRSGLTVLSWSSGELLISPSPVRLTPAALLHYRYEQTTVGANGLPAYERTVSGLAVLDQDGLVLADLPGDWEGVSAFARAGGVPLHAALDAPAARVRAVLAARAPGWRRIAGVPPAPAARWRRPVAIGLGVAALGIMIYLTSNGFWYVWRGFSAIGRMLIDVVEVKWLIFLFSPLLLFLAPVRERLTRRSVRKGVMVGSVGGLHLKLTSGILYINRGPQTLTALPVTPLPTPSQPTAPTRTAPTRTAPTRTAPSPPASPAPASPAPAPSAPAWIPPSPSAPTTPSAPTSLAPSPPASPAAAPASLAPADPPPSPVADLPPTTAPAVTPSPAAQADHAQPLGAPSPADPTPPPADPTLSPADPAPSPEGVPLGAPHAETPATLTPDASAVPHSSSPDPAPGSGAWAAPAADARVEETPGAQAPSNPVDRPEPKGRAEGFAARLFLYRHRDLAGLVVLAADGHPVHHLPGPWSPEHVNRFATRHNLPLEIRTLTHDEYLALTADSADATT
ncbi:hypothetical protein [Nonomuraea sp. NPDC050540]|uniref:hypothetical protein n=1 Tax=Nonomuraea sp. NPDC050540 TaxID=3364367 RepID=UPI00379F77D9